MEFLFHFIVICFYPDHQRAVGIKGAGTDLSSSKNNLPWMELNVSLSLPILFLTGIVMQIFGHNWLEIVLRAAILLIQAFTTLFHSVSLFAITLSMKLTFPSLVSLQIYCEMSLMAGGFLPAGLFFGG